MARDLCRSFDEFDSLPAPDGDFFRPGGLELTARALAFCQLPARAKVLDVGSGGGATAAYLTDRHHFIAVGIDPSRMQLEHSRLRRPDLRLIEARGECLPIRDGSVPAVVAECTLSTMSDPKLALAEFDRVLENAGYLVLSDIYVRNEHRTDELRQLPTSCCFRDAMTQQEILGTLRAHGFQILLWEDHSETMKAFAAQVVWSGGSVADLLDASPPGDLARLYLHDLMREAKLGYFLLVARKASRPRLVGSSGDLAGEKDRVGSSSANNRRGGMLGRWKDGR